MITITIQTDTADQAMEDIRALFAGAAVAQIAIPCYFTMAPPGGVVVCDNPTIPEMVEQMPTALREENLDATVAEVAAAVEEAVAPPAKEKKPRGKKVETVVVPVEEPAPISDFVEEVEAAVPPTLQDLRDAMRDYMARLMKGKGLDENTAALKVKDVLLALGFKKAGLVPEDKRAECIAALGRAE